MRISRANPGPPVELKLFLTRSFAAALSELLSGHMLSNRLIELITRLTGEILSHGDLDPRCQKLKK